MCKRAYFACFVLITLLAGAAGAQTISGSITGTVTDPTGAVVVNAKVTAVNAGTGVSNNATTNESGVYRLLFLPVGAYTVSIEGSGFKKYSVGPVRLEVNQIARVDAKLELGDTAQTIEVSAAAAILQTESTTTGDTITSTKLTALPLNGRNFASLTLLIPGAISTSPGAMNTSARFQGSGSRPQVNGNREQTNNFMLDGVDVNDSIDNRIGYQPNVDALEEVKVLTGNAAGEFGNVGGATVIMTIKSGTNEFHGNLFEFLRNDKLDANGFFANRASTQRSALRRNIFGGTLGGPIKENKLFFFIDYEGTEQRTSTSTGTASLAPAAWRTGDLSDFLRISNLVVRDPRTGPTSATRTPFPGNIIPGNRITNPVARYLFSNPSIYPLPNRAGTGTLGVGSNYLSVGGAGKIRNHQADAKIDWRPNDKDSISGRWSIGRYESATSRAVLPTTMTGGNYGPTTSAVVNWVRAFTPRLVNDARVSYSFVGIDDNVLDWSGLLGADGNAKFGIPGGQFIPGLSGVGLDANLTGIGAGASIGSTADHKYMIGTNMTYQAGSHLVKFGGQLFRIQQNRYYAGNNGALGSFGYSGTYSGVGFGDFLLDALASKGRGAVSGKWGHRHWRNALFLQDDYKLRPNFTLNLGMRWEYITPIYEVADRQVNIDVFTGALRYPGRDGNNRALYEPYRKQFMPRIGFAWTPGVANNKLVVRAGYAFTTFLEGTGANLRLTLNPPFFIEANINYDANAPGTITTGFTDVISRGDLTGPRTGTAPFFQARAWERNLRPQFTNQFNFATEYQLDSVTSISAAYVGQRGTHLVVPHEANNPLPGTGPVGTWIPADNRRPLAQALPNVGNIALTESSGTMWYNSLQTSMRRRLNRGLEVLAQYTLSKTNTDNLGYYGCGGVNHEGAYWQDAYNRRGNYGPACFDATHNFTTGGLYNLPFGKGKSMGANWSRPLDLLLGGWNVNYFVSTHSGFPVTIQATTHNTGGRTPRGNIRANRYGLLSVTGVRTVDSWFGKVFTASDFCATGVTTGCAYGTPVLGELGNAGVGTERAPGYFSMDTSVGKRFAVTERHVIEFRAEGFNILNFVSWGAPGRNISTPASFGAIGGQINPARNFQFGLKYAF